MRADPDDLADAPVLAVLAVLHATLDQAVMALVTQHREIAEGEDLVGLPPAAWLADLLASAARDLQHLLERYRLAVLDHARHRACNPITQMPLPIQPR